MNWSTEWSFTTNRFTVTLDIHPCEDDPEDFFEFEEDVEAIRSGDVLWFDARVRVYGLDTILAEEHLCGNSYDTIEDFLTGHRDADPMNRNCSLMRAEKGDNVCICHYFPDMIRCAISDARNTFATLKKTYQNTNLRAA